MASFSFLHDPGLNGTLCMTNEGTGRRSNGGRALMKQLLVKQESEIGSKRAE